MNQAKKYELMSGYIDGNLTKDELKDFNQILVDDVEFKNEVEEVKSTLKKIKSIKSLKLSNDFDAKLKNSIDSQNRKKSFPYKILSIFDNPILTTAGSVAAAIVLVVVTTIFFSSKSTAISDTSYLSDDFSYAEPKDDLDEYPDPNLEINMTGNSIEDVE